MDKKEINLIIASNLRTIMNDRGISVSELSRRSKRNSGSISRALAGKVSLTSSFLVDLTSGLNVSITDAFKGIATEKNGENTKKKEKISKNQLLFIGIMSINNQRVTYVKNYAGEIIGTSTLSGGLDLVETLPNVLQLITDSIEDALPQNRRNPASLKQAHLAIVLQSYEFEETRVKFELFAMKKFGSIILLPDWQITHLTAFGKNPGISLVIDKGVSLSYSTQGGNLKKLGGYKFPVYDLGGENWLGLETIRHTVEAYEGYVPMSELAQSVLNKYDGKMEKITEYCFKSGKNPDVYCDFVPTLLHHYLTGDQIANDIIKQGFSLICKGVNRADNLLGKKYKITLSGSLTKIYKGFIATDRMLPSPDDNKKVLMLTDIAKDKY